LSVDELGNWCLQRLVGICKNTKHSREVPWQPCEWEPTLKAVTNRHHHTKGTSVEKLTRPNSYHDPIPMRDGKGWALNWQNRPQSSDLQRSMEHATRAHTQAHGKASPCGHPADLQQLRRWLDAFTQK